MSLVVGKKTAKKRIKKSFFRMVAWLSRQYSAWEITSPRKFRKVFNILCISPIEQQIFEKVIQRQKRFCTAHLNLRWILHIFRFLSCRRWNSKQNKKRTAKVIKYSWSKNCIQGTRSLYYKKWHETVSESLYN